MVIQEILPLFLYHIKYLLNLNQFPYSKLKNHKNNILYAHGRLDKTMFGSLKNTLKKSYKETIETGTLAAANGGFTAVCSMPNIFPAPDSVENLKIQTDLIKQKAKVHVYPYACITKGSKGEYLSDMDELAEYVIAFTDDGKGVQSDEMMQSAMLKAKSLNKMIVAHCEDERYGTSAESEYIQVKRDLELVSKIGCKYHLCQPGSFPNINPRVNLYLNQLQINGQRP